MPLAGDAYLGGQLPAPNNPLNRIQVGSFNSLIDPIKVLEQWVQWLEKYGLQAIQQVTGVDLSILQPLLDTFNGLLSGFGASSSILTQLIGLFTGTTGGLTGLSGLGSIFGDLTGLLGNPTALGSGAPVLGSLGSIPILGPVFGLFGGATTSTQAGNYFTNLLSLLGGPTLTGSPGSFNTNTAATNFINTVLNPTGLLASVTAIVNAITGSSGSLTNLTSWINDLTALLGSPAGLGSGTVTPGALGSTPLLAPLQALINGVVGGSGNPLSALISSLTGTASTASTANTNASTALSNFTSLINGVVGGTGNPLSSLISSLTGTASTASTANTNASTALSNFTSLINGVVGGTGNPLSALISSLTGTQTTASNNASSITSLISNLFGGSTIGSTIQTGAVPTLPDLKLPGLGSLMDGLFGGFTGATSSGATQTNVNAATASQADATAGNSALITQIQAALGAGTPDSDDFERATLGANWTFLSSTGTGTIPDSHNFHFSGTGTAEYVMRKNDVVGSTDHITSTIVLNQAIPASFISIPPYGGNIDVWVRQTAFTTYATRTGVRLRINSSSLAGSYSLDWVNAGTVTNLTSGSCPIPAAGAIIQLEAGASATPRRIVGTINGSPIVDFIDTGLVTTIGTANRYRGFGGRGASGIGLAQGTPDIRQWTAQG